MGEVQGKITIAPGVLTTIVRLTTLDVPGIHRLAPQHAPVRTLRTSVAAEDGVFVMLTDQGVRVEVHVVVETDSKMLQVGEAVQVEVKRALEHMVDMPVVAVDVHIEGVALESGRP